MADEGTTATFRTIGGNTVTFVHEGYADYGLMKCNGCHVTKRVLVGDANDHAAGCRALPAPAGVDAVALDLAVQADTYRKRSAGYLEKASGSLNAECDGYVKRAQVCATLAVSYEMARAARVATVAAQS